LPQLEYPRAWPPEAHIVGPLMWEPPFADVDLPPGDQPLVLIAPSTAQDPEQRLLTSALEGLAGEPIRVLASTNRKPLPRPVVPPANARLVEWLSYSRTIPQAALVVCHAGHGTVVRTLACGTPLLAVPHSGDMAENAARIDWAGVGVRLPWRLLSPRTLRLAVGRALREERFAVKAQALAAWARDHDGPTRAAELVEELAFSRGARRARAR
jgi:UDP:flavonoid glycosyltransferase YjiC (YdhE family)